MSFMAELMVDEYGYLFGGETIFPVDTIDHDWRTPYPRFDEVVEFTWQPGEVGTKPSFFRHPEIRDWVCDKTAWTAISDIAAKDLHLIGQGDLGGERLFIVQVVSILDVIDRAASIIDKLPSYEVLRFPSFLNRAKVEVARRVFRVPGSYTDLFMGVEVKRELDAAKISGLRYVPVPFAQLE